VVVYCDCFQIDKNKHALVPESSDPLERTSNEKNVSGGIVLLVNICVVYLLVHTLRLTLWRASHGFGSAVASWFGTMRFDSQKMERSNADGINEGGLGLDGYHLALMTRFNMT